VGRRSHARTPLDEAIARWWTNDPPKEPRADVMGTVHGYAVRAKQWYGPCP
jgi:hypothetical protein